MARRTPSGSSPRDQHLAWLQLVDTDGPFLALPELLRVWPQGMPRLDDAAKVTLIDAKPSFDRAWDDWDRERDEPSLRRYRTARDTWVETVLRDVLGWGDLWAPVTATTSPWRVSAPDHTVTVTATGALRHEDRVGALGWVIDPVDNLRDLMDDGWASSPLDRMELMLRDSGVPVGVVTDGRWWALVSAAPKTLAASGVVDAQTWVAEPAGRDAFVALLGVTTLLGGEEDRRLPALFANSVLAAEEVTEALGVQVRKAVELVVQALSERAVQARRQGDPDPLPADGDTVYQAVVTVLMRVVFLLFAEERGLLPQGSLFEQGYGLAGRLGDLEHRSQSEGEDALEGTYGVWHRLLATSQALYTGATFEDLRLPAYGGSLFDPDRFPMLTKTTDRGSLALPVSDRVMLHVLRAVQTAKVKGQPARRISFRVIDVEQIGYIYEGLLGHTCVVADEVVLGLIGREGEEPEIPLELLDDLYDEHGTDAGTAEAVIAWVKDDQPASKAPSQAALTKAFAAGDTMEGAEQLLRSVSTDADLRDRLRPWLGAVRRDLRGWPVVTVPGGLLLTETPSRRNAGAHYTPRELAEEVVLHALEPIVYAPGPHQTPDRDAWRLKSSTELLDLKVADIACGSGAFLVAATRYLAARLTEAWRAEGLTRHLSPHEAETRALREVVAHCLYGADINAMAVEMCKLSLWLVSLDRDLPFSFVDDKVLHGNSLLGITTLRQFEELHIDPPTAPRQYKLTLTTDNELVDRLDLDRRIQRAISLRRQLASQVDDTDPQRTATAKRAQMAQLDEVTRSLRLVADGIIAAGLRVGGKPGRVLNEGYENLRSAVHQAVPADTARANPAALQAILQAGLTPTVDTDYERWKPLHWPLEVPDVMARGGFDAIVGNPPFLGGKKITPALGQNMREWFVHQVAEGVKGNADLVAYFFLRAQSLLGRSGTMGLIATNTIAQGDTREVGLDRMVHTGFTITRGIQSRTWPAASANLEYAAVWGGFGPVSELATRTSDGETVPLISTLLEATGRARGLPARLSENRAKAYIGMFARGMGFVVSNQEAAAWMAADSRNRDVLRMYLSGEDVNSDPQFRPSRWIIDFSEYDERSASHFHEPFQRLVTGVRPERMRVNQEDHKRRWWQFANTRPGLRRAIEGLDEVLVQTIHSSTLQPVRVPTGCVFSHGLAVLAVESFATQAALSSSVHQLWALRYGSTIGKGIRYTPTDVFETYPQPLATEVLHGLGKVLDEERREVMLRRELGLTKLYNVVNDADVADVADTDVARMRQIHVELDHAVMAAYGWDDLALDHGFHTYRQMERWTVSPAARVEILDRLLEENHRRAALQGQAPASDEDETNGDEEATDA